MTYWQTQHFRAMQAAWYKRLRESGFEDAEVLVGSELHLKSQYVTQIEAKERESRADYYRALGEHIQTAIFKTEIDKVILTSRAEGLRIKDICARLRAIGKPRDRLTVRIRIRVYEMRWGMRVYTKKQLYNCRVG